MAEATRARRPGAARAEMPAPLWPIYMAIGLLVGSTFGVVAATAPFPDPQPLWKARQWWALVESGWGQSALVGMLAVLLLAAAAILRRAAVRRLQLCLILSLVFHLWLAVFLHTQHLHVWLVAREQELPSLDESSLERFPDYHWEALEEPERMEEFERPVPAEPQAPSPLSPPKPPAQPPPRWQPKPLEPIEPTDQTLPESPTPKRVELPPPDQALLPPTVPVARQDLQVRVERSETVRFSRVRPGGTARPPEPGEAARAVRQVPEGGPGRPAAEPDLGPETAILAAELALQRAQPRPSPEPVAGQAALRRAVTAGPEPMAADLAAPETPPASAAAPLASLDAPPVAAPARAGVGPTAATAAEPQTPWNALPAPRPASPRRLDADLAIETVAAPNALRRMASPSVAPLVLHPAAEATIAPSARPAPPPGASVDAAAQPASLGVERQATVAPSMATFGRPSDLPGNDSLHGILPPNTARGPRRTAWPPQDLTSSGAGTSGGAGVPDGSAALLRRSALATALPGTTVDEPQRPVPGTASTKTGPSQPETADAPGQPAGQGGVGGTMAGPSRQGVGPGRFALPLPVAGSGPAASKADSGAGALPPGAVGLRMRREGAQAAPLVEEPAGRPSLPRSPAVLSLEGKLRDEPKPAFQARQPGQRAARARAYGTQQWEQAVERGIEFLVRHQFPDGHWSLDRSPHDAQPGYAEAAWGEMHGDTAATGLALLALLGAGYTHLEGKYREPVWRGLEWLIRNQRPDGCLFTPQTDRTRFAQFYGHGMAAIALCEAYGMTGDRQLRGPAQQAVNFILASQHPELGGWRYVPQLESDTSVSGWMLMALKSAQMAGLEVPAEALAKVSRWLDLAQAAGGAQYRYNPYAADTPQQRQGRRPNLAMTAEGLLMRMYLGWPQNHPPLVEGARFLQTNLPALGTAAQPTRDSYYWYYATQVMFQMQGEFWTAWYRRLGPLLAESQVLTGPLAGSWHPQQPVPDRWAREGGRLYVTTLNLLMLEVPYRYLPLYGELLR